MSTLNIDLENITEDVAGELIRKIARAAGMPVQIWSREDFYPDEYASEDLTDAEREKIRDRVWSNKKLDALTDCYQADWDFIQDLQREAASELGIEF